VRPVAEPSRCHYPLRPALKGYTWDLDRTTREQKDQDVDTDDDNAVNVHENDHDGEVTIEGGASTDDLVGRLSEMKDDEDDE